MLESVTAETLLKRGNISSKEERLLISVSLCNTFLCMAKRKVGEVCVLELIGTGGVLSSCLGLQPWITGQVWITGVLPSCLGFYIMSYINLCSEKYMLLNISVYLVFFSTRLSYIQWYRHICLKYSLLLNLKLCYVRGIPNCIGHSFLLYYCSSLASH